MRFELPAEKKQVHELLIPIRWGDMDTMGHVNNTLYFRFMEIARLDWVFQIGGSTRRDGQGPVMINGFCNFLKQLEFPGDVRVCTYVADPGRSSVQTYHTMERSDQPGVVYAEGGARLVWTDYAARKSVPLPDWFRQLL